MAYVLRQTLGWLDEQGNPQRQDIEVSYLDLIKKAGVSRGAIASALQEAVDLGFLECRQTGEMSAADKSGRSARYSLRWSDANYTGCISEFDGFFAGEGNRTPVPNEFFDQVVVAEALSVIRVVGAVIRQTIGYQNQFGGRRSSHPLSYSSLLRLVRLKDRTTLAKAIRVAKERGYVVCVDEGHFTSSPDRQKAASYSIRWLHNDEKSETSSKTRPESDQTKNQTSTRSKTRPANRFKNQTTKKKKQPKDNSKQQHTAADVLIQNGMNEATARKLCDEYGEGAVLRQVEWIDSRNPRNRVAMLRKAIEQDWEMPEAIAQREKIATRRANDELEEAKRRMEEVVAAERKKLRQRRKRRLLDVWESASTEERERWIKTAVKKETSRVIREMLRRQDASDDEPRVQVLEVVARENSLPSVIEKGQHTG